MHEKQTDRDRLTKTM